MTPCSLVWALVNVVMKLGMIIMFSKITYKDITLARLSTRSLMMVEDRNM
jgi:hypothetical protein